MNSDNSKRNLFKLNHPDIEGGQLDPIYYYHVNSTTEGSSFNFKFLKVFSEHVRTEFETAQVEKKKMHLLTDM